MCGSRMSRMSKKPLFDIHTLLGGVKSSGSPMIQQLWCKKNVNGFAQGNNVLLFGLEPQSPD